MTFLDLGPKGAMRILQRVESANQLLVAVSLDSLRKLLLKHHSSGVPTLARLPPLHNASHADSCIWGVASSSAPSVPQAVTGQR